MAFTVLRVPSVRHTVENELTKRERRAYDAARDALKGQGCRAGGKRLAAVDAGDYPMCQRSLYGSWRMTTVYRQDGSIVIVSVAKPTNDENPAATLAEIFPGLSAVGRGRSDQPACCHEATAPPTLGPELEALRFDLFGV
jgi:hypothetical protein